MGGKKVPARDHIGGGFGLWGPSHGASGLQGNAPERRQRGSSGCASAAGTGGSVSRAEVPRPKDSDPEKHREAGGN